MCGNWQMLYNSFCIPLGCIVSHASASYQGTSKSYSLTVLVSNGCRRPGHIQKGHVVDDL